MTNDEDKFLDKFYARSVSVIHYLNADPQRRRQLHQYLSLISKGYGIDQSFEHVFNLSYEEFDAQIDAYIDGKFVLARVFEIGKNGIVFPSTPIQTFAISNTQAMSFLYSKISSLSDDFLGDGQREKMNEDIEAMIPGFFAQ